MFEGENQNKDNDPMQNNFTEDTPLDEEDKIPNLLSSIRESDKVTGENIDIQLGAVGSDDDTETADINRKCIWHRWAAFKTEQLKMKFIIIPRHCCSYYLYPPPFHQVCPPLTPA